MLMQLRADSGVPAAAASWWLKVSMIRDMIRPSRVSMITDARNTRWALRTSLRAIQDATVREMATGIPAEDTVSIRL